MADRSYDSFTMSTTERELRTAFVQQVEHIPDGNRIKQCIQCGTCTGTCPVSFAMEITPRKVIALFRAGEIEQILRSNTIWICASCYACTVRCPASIKITDIMYAFKRIAMERHIYPKKFPVHALSSSFVAYVNAYGRNPEVRLLATYAMKTNPRQLFANAWLGARLWTKGRIRLAPQRIKNTNQLAAILSRALSRKNASAVRQQTTTLPQEVS